MPQSDGALPFVCACVGFTGQLRRETETDGRSAWLLDFIRGHGGIPHVCFVQPNEGYEEALKATHRQREQMALITRATTGSNQAFVPESGLSLANHIWGKVMVIAIGQLALTAAAEGPVDRVVVVLDQKTMKSETRHLFRHTTERIGTVLREEGHKSRHLDPAAAAYINGNLRFANKDIALRWSDEIRKEPFGLRIAHLLASLSWHQLTRPGYPGLLDDLRGFSQHSCISDITGIVSAPLPEDQVRRWRENNEQGVDGQART